MRICDRCEGRNAVERCTLLLKAERSESTASDPLDLCADCRATVAELTRCKRLNAPDMLRVLDGETPPDVVESLKPATEASEEIPFDGTPEGATEFGRLWRAAGRGRAAGRVSVSWRVRAAGEGAEEVRALARNNSERGFKSGYVGTNG